MYRAARFLRWYCNEPVSKHYTALSQNFVTAESAAQRAGAECSNLDSFPGLQQTSQQRSLRQGRGTPQSGTQAPARRKTEKFFRSARRDMSRGRSNGWHGAVSRRIGRRYGSKECLLRGKPMGYHLNPQQSSQPPRPPRHLRPLDP